ncbi:LysR substrate-binding domain-containing protein [Robbsia sp. KACC 23696]|uniref:LysR substrate-binding domain-containing protein n=1 Tax=Robbsia sp. KACC 23696 TaxID=3149231 RepID=UPI00325AF547
MNTPLDLDLVRTFVAVADTGSFTTAALRVHRSQSAISMQMQRLEQTVGKTLLDRSPRAVKATATGEAFLVYARRLLKLSDEAWASVTRPEETGSVRFGVPDDYAAFVLPGVLARFAAAHPLVTVELICAPSVKLLRAMDEGKIDVAVVTRLPTQAFAVSRYEPFVWVASPQYVDWDADPLPIALFDGGCAARRNVVQALGEAGRQYRSTYSSESLLGLSAIVQAGLAVAGLARCSVPPTLRIVGEAEGLPPLKALELSVVKREESEGAATQRLAAFLHRNLAGPPRDIPLPGSVNEARV